MSLENFFKVLPRLSKEISPNEINMARSMRTMVHQYFEPLYEDIMKKTFCTSSRTQSGNQIEEDEFNILASVKQKLSEFEQPKNCLPLVLPSRRRLAVEQPFNR